MLGGKSRRPFQHWRTAANRPRVTIGVLSRGSGFTMSIGHGEKLTRKKEACIAALLASPNIIRAAEVAGVSSRTLKAWLKLDSFKEEYRAARSAVLTEAVADLKAATQRATAVLVQCLNSRSPGHKIRAVLGLLDQALSGTRNWKWKSAFAPWNRNSTCKRKSPNESEISTRSHREDD